MQRGILEIKDIGISSAEDEKVRLTADVLTPDQPERTLYYEVDAAYGECLCMERSDPFVLGLLAYAMLNEYDITCKVPVSEQLYYQLTTYLIPIVSKNVPHYHHIVIRAPLADQDIVSKGGVGTGFSGGVDSYYTVLKHLHPATPSFQLTHLLFANIGALTHISTHANQIFAEKSKRMSVMAAQLGLPLVTVDTNYLDFFGAVTVEKTGGPDALKTCSCVYALRKLFKTYYFGSGMELERFTFSAVDPALYDILTLQTISVNSLWFYSSGAEASRMEKLEYIVDHPIVQKTLTVCADSNCNRCNKCIRTMMELYALKKLDHFADVFDVPDFKQHLATRFATNLARKQEYVDGYNQDTLRMAKQNHVRIPWLTKVLLLGYKPFFALKAALRDNDRVRKLYYRFNLDKKLYGDTAVKQRRTDL